MNACRMCQTVCDRPSRTSTDLGNIPHPIPQHTFSMSPRHCWAPRVCLRSGQPWRIHSCSFARLWRVHLPIFTGRGILPESTSRATVRGATPRRCAASRVVRSAGVVLFSSIDRVTLPWFESAGLLTACQDGTPRSGWNNSENMGRLFLPD